jgi:nicotinamide riboside transporter PnuC
MEVLWTFPVLVFPNGPLPLQPFGKWQPPSSPTFFVLHVACVCLVVGRVLGSWSLWWVVVVVVVMSWRTKGSVREGGAKAYSTWYS